MSINKMESGKPIEYWRSVHQEYFPGMTPANSIRGIRQRVQRCIAEVSNREAKDHLHSLSQEIVTGRADLVRVPVHELLASTRVCRTIEVSNFKSYDKHAEQLQKELKHHGSITTNIRSGVIYQNERE